MRLEKNEKYDISTLTLTGWNNPKDEDTTGYNVADYFENGVYLGPDEYGIEPEFKDTPLYVVTASIDNVIQDSAEYLGEYLGVRFGSKEAAEAVAEELQSNVDEYGLHPETIYEISIA